MSRKMWFCILIFLLPGLSGQSPVQAQTPSSFVLEATQKKSSVGSEVMIAFQAMNLNDVYAYDISLAFDPAKLRFKDAASGITGMSIEPILKGGEVRFAHTMIGNVPGISGNTTLATFTFDAIGSGSTEVVLKENKLVDSKLELSNQLINRPVKALLDLWIPYRDLGLKWSWAEEAIGYLSSKGIVDGTKDDKFDPSRPVKRGDLMLMLARAFKFEARAQAIPFSDVPRNKYYYDAIMAAKSLGIAGGYENRFNPEAPISRQDLMVLLNRTQQITRSPLTAAEGKEVDDFADRTEIAGYALESVSVMVKAGIVKGSSKGIEPEKTANRAEAAVFLHRLLSTMSNSA